MKINNFSKFLLSSLVISIITVGCGKKNTKGESKFFRVKLASLQTTGLETNKSSEASTSESEYSIIGYYQNCSEKNPKDHWILSMDPKKSTLEVKQNDINCKLSIATITVDDLSYRSNKLPEEIILGENPSAPIRFYNINNKKDIIFLNVDITPRDYSRAPVIKAKLSSVYEENKVEIEGSTQVKAEIESSNQDKIEKTPVATYKALSLALEQSLQTPYYSSDKSNLQVEFDTEGNLIWNGNLTFKLKSKAQKATHYFIFPGDLEFTTSEDYVPFNIYVKGLFKSEDAKTVDSSVDSFTVSKDELEKQTNGTRIKVGEEFTLNVVLVNTKNNSYSYSIHPFPIKRIK